MRPMRICPRCGAPYSYTERRIVHGIEYHYAVHEKRENGRRTRTRHYLGPATYTAGQATHMALGVEWEGAATPDPARLHAYLRAVLGAIARRRDEFDEAGLDEIRRELERALDEL
ncbi:hypothetical protein NAS2_1025 [Conexivisphaera calida]|uniref:Uncharacterized protein n=1 Tax=Conexivisphaera calida TaxID=1874277 RepID=A0A4P2VCZ8_9ARCH|nr:hypothetical protein NAS2_1025 [Conexivisphaera calida]